MNIVTSYNFEIGSIRVERHTNDLGVEHYVLSIGFSDIVLSKDDAIKFADELYNDINR